MVGTMDCSVFQSKEWEHFKLETGYEKSYRVEDILVLQKKLPLKKTLLYSPMVSEQQLAGIRNKKLGIRDSFIEEIKDIAEQNNSIFYRLELNIPKLETATAFGGVPSNGGKNCELRTPQNFVKSFEEMQPENNWLLDLRKSEEELLLNMKQKGRYNIKVAAKNNITISRSSEPGKELDAFYKQYSETGNRHKITYREKKYFDHLLEILGKSGYARVYVAYTGKTALASAVMLFYRDAALYLYGGSSEEHRNLMAPYLLHWEIIKEAKALGLKEYNFLGVAPNDDPAHSWAGITRFKKQFGGEQVDILGSYDLPLRPLQYQGFKLAERLRRH